MPRRTAFSLVEVTLALGILAFSLLTVAALIPIGLKSNQSSMQETRAANLLAALENDLRNTWPTPGSTTPKSQIFGLPLPYVVSSVPTSGAGRAQLNAAVPTAVLNTTGVSDNDTAVSVNAQPPFQASVIYYPVAANPTTIQARLIINWPATTSTDPLRFTSNRGYLESFVTFPAP